jgi:hypothetical protein
MPIIPLAVLPALPPVLIALFPQLCSHIIILYISDLYFLSDKTVI